MPVGAKWCVPKVGEYIAQEPNCLARSYPASVKKYSSAAEGWYRMGVGSGVEVSFILSCQLNLEERTCWTGGRRANDLSFLLRVLLRCRSHSRVLECPLRPWFTLVAMYLAVLRCVGSERPLMVNQ